MQSTPHPSVDDATPAAPRRRFRRLTLAATTVAAIGATMLGAAPAHAATANPYSPTNVCDGGGFVVIDKHPLARSTVYLLRSNYYSSRYCVVTRMNQIDGSSGLMARLYAPGVGSQLDVNVAYKYYASATLDTANNCFEWAGWDSASSFTSELGHCW